MNGSIAIKSKINTGTTFVVLLPLERAQLQKNTDNALLQTDTAFLAAKTILVADDFADNRFVIKETVGFFNKDTLVLEASDGLQALETLKKHTVDLVIMDLDMPNMNGFEALSEIRKDKKLKKLNVVASTASLITNGDEEFIEFGFDGYLPKPFEMNAFLALLEKMLKQC